MPTLAGIVSWLTPSLLPVAMLVFSQNKYSLHDARQKQVQEKQNPMEELLLRASKLVMENKTLMGNEVLLETLCMLKSKKV